jgi:hypothetical protein
MDGSVKLKRSRQTRTMLSVIFELNWTRMGVNCGGFSPGLWAWNRHLPCVFAKTAYNPRAPSILVGS